MRRFIGFGMIGLAVVFAALALVMLGDRGEAGNLAAVEEALRPVSLGPAPPPATESAVSVPEADETSADPQWLPNEGSRFDQLLDQMAPAPVGVSIPALDVQAEVDPYGIDDRTGQMDVPSNVSDVAWYRFGPSPGEPGSAVLAAHVDLQSQGPGVFFHLKTLEPGDVITVEYSDGSTGEFEVAARTVYEKEELPLDLIFSRDGAPTLTLITCGGGFSESEASYDSNVVVYAVPAGTEIGPEDAS